MKQYHNETFFIDDVWIENKLINITMHNEKYESITIERPYTVEGGEDQTITVGTDLLLGHHVDYCGCPNDINIAIDEEGYHIRIKKVLQHSFTPAIRITIK